MYALRAAVRPAAVVAAAFALALGAAAQSPAPPAPPPVQETSGSADDPFGTRSRWDAGSIPDESAAGPISGRVIDAQSGQPVPGALVVVHVSDGSPAAIPPGRSQTAAAGLAVLSDGLGRFVIPRVMDGLAVIEATRPGYLPGALGRRRPGGPARTIALEHGQLLPDVTIRLWRPAAVTGTIVDEADEPMVEATVRALRIDFVNGRQRLLPSAEPARSDDRGIYRLSALPPGDYVIVASAEATGPASLAELVRRAAGSGSPVRVTRVTSDGQTNYTVVAEGNPLAPPAGPDGRVLSYPPVYFPATTAAGQAEVVHLDAGTERAGVDFVLSASPAVPVSGFVLGPEGPSAGASVRLVPAGLGPVSSDATLETAVTLADASGRFRLAAVPPGQYVLRANSATGRGATLSMDGDRAFRFSTAPSSPGASPVRTADLPVVVDEEEIDGLVVSLSEGGTLSGRVQVGPAEEPSASVPTIGIALLGIDRLPLSPVFGPARSERDGTFVTSAYPAGRYVLDVAVPAGWHVASAIAGGRDLARDSFDLGPEGLHEVVITLSQRAGTVTGSVRSATGQFEEHAAVVLFPFDYADWIRLRMDDSRSRVTLTDARGFFALEEIPPGNYMIAGVSPEIPADERNPAVIASLAATATPVVVGDGTTISLALAMAPAR